MRTEALPSLISHCFATAAEIKPHKERGGLLVNDTAGEGPAACLTVT